MPGCPRGRWWSVRPAPRPCCSARSWVPPWCRRPIRSRRSARPRPPRRPRRRSPHPPSATGERVSRRLRDAAVWGVNPTAPAAVSHRGRRGLRGQAGASPGPRGKAAASQAPRAVAAGTRPTAEAGEEGRTGVPAACLAHRTGAPAAGPPAEVSGGRRRGHGAVVGHAESLHPPAYRGAPANAGIMSATNHRTIRCTPRAPKICRQEATILRVILNRLVRPTIDACAGRTVFARHR